MEQHNISVNDSSDYDGSDYDGSDYDLDKYDYALLVFMRILAGIEIRVIILTLIALCFLVKSRPAASVFVVHLILSDLVQVICLLIGTAISWPYELAHAYDYSLIAGLYFMACVSFERYLLVSHPIWYKSHQTLKLSCFISVIVWFLPLIFTGILPDITDLHLSIVCLIPYPIVVLCFVGTWRGLSRSISLTALKRKLILGSLFLVLLTYTFIILPFVIVKLTLFLHHAGIFRINELVFIKCLYFSRLLLYMNPLADCMLYLFIRPDVGDLMKSVHCCCKHKQDEQSVVNPLNSCSTVVCCISAQKPESHSSNTCSSV